MNNEQLLEWVKVQPTWIKDAVVTYYKNGLFTDKDIDRFAQECMP